MGCIRLVPHSKGDRLEKGNIERVGERLCRLKSPCCGGVLSYDDTFEAASCDKGDLKI